ncbi:hypothetical protein O1D97_03840 [Marinomonas sp. 15G1-11]|uniref:LPS-assembly lipoprotein LptE n=1 Tax=Marinomonas phaeophyticola TaxID=3004091 RepID=A0ABT4JR92_9GAMM|nr:LPS assembly lipoprotein LptE [Marinomonas sp. 15G1-11]MCZ2720796.1 hypothetical protein [Marinomonas sp. 15G1-11]
MISNYLWATRLSMVLAFTFILSACGFHLRGSTPISPALQNIVINSQSGLIVFDQALNSALRRAGINVVNSGTPATGDAFELMVNPLSSQETILGTASNNDVLQLERQLTTHYFIRQANGKSLYGPRRISTSKLFTEQDASVNTKEASDADALNDMAEDLAEKLLLDLSYAPL